MPPVSRCERPGGSPALAMAMFVLVVDTSLMNVSISAVVARPGHDRQRRPVGDRARGAGLGGVHPDRQQGRRPDRPQAGLRPRAARLRDRRAGHDARPEPDRDHHLLGDHRRARRVAAAARDAVADPRQLRGRGADARSTPWSARRPRSPPPSARCSAASSRPTCRGASAFLLEVVIIAIVLSGIKLVHDVAVHRARGRSTSVGARAVGRRHGRHRARHPGLAGGRRGRRRAARRSARSRWARSSAGWCGASARASRRCSTRTCSRRKLFRLGITGQMLQQIALGGTMIALPIYLQMVLEYNAMQAGLSLAPLSLSMFARGADRRASGRASGARAGIIRLGFVAAHGRAWSACSRSCRGPTPAGACWSRWSIAGSGLGLLVSQLNNYTLSPIAEERVSEAAGVNSAAGSFGLSFGLAFAGAIMLATLSLAFTHMADASTVLAPAEQQQVSTALEHDAEVMSNTALARAARRPARRTSRPRSSASAQSSPKCWARSTTWSSSGVPISPSPARGWQFSISSVVASSGNPGPRVPQEGRRRLGLDA